ncbi:MAG: hypothetical protein HW403_81 [Dehalococcoidia bacterium]|nr:hypothetical protein [Dehalococcoidia bacterium]
MVWYKSCPKCHIGDLMLEKDPFGWYRQCVQCGYLEDLATAKVAALVREPVGATKQAA